ncbi:hypothetical protein F4803DRAFT_222370 [Xylaria telfairii]|nr:hypothetical protein F4803DRAFT_222370 [Xylaria telfairii]
MADVSSCPEDANSTDCLLRLVLQRLDDHYAEYDWDPITFGFTAPVGILAALFAAFTIYQAIIAASQGSRRANKRAIGKWSDQTTKSWDWHGLSQISTARTPTLTISTLMEKSSLRFQHPDYIPASTDDHHNPHRNHNKWGILVDKLQRRLGYDSKGTNQGSQDILLRDTSRDPAVASWLGFLGELGLSYSDLVDVPLQQHIADYLPSDLLAVPAYGQVGFIVAAAAATGAYSWQPDPLSRFPTVLSHTMQFEFRQHQTLGTVGAFVKYGDSSRVPSKPDAKQLMTAFLQSTGNVEISRFLTPNVTNQGPVYGVSSSPCLVTPKTPHRLFNALRDSSMLYMEVLGSVDTPEKKPSHDRRGCLCRYHTPTEHRRDRHNLTWLFMVNTPLLPPVIFPSQHLQNPDILTILALHSKFWASLNTKRQFSSIDERTPLPKFLLQSRGWHNRSLPVDPSPENLSKILDDLNECTKPGHMTNEDYVKSERKPEVYKVVLEESIKFLYDIEEFNLWFNNMQQLKRQYFRVLILLQILGIDNQLTALDQRDHLICEMNSLWRTTLALLDVKRSISDGSFGFSTTSGGGTGWDGALPTGYPQDDISGRHYPTLQILGQLLDAFTKAQTTPPGSTSVNISDNITELVTPLCRLADVPSNSDFIYDYFQSFKLILEALAGVLEICHKSIMSNVALPVRTKIEYTRSICSYPVTLPKGKERSKKRPLDSQSQTSNATIIAEPEASTRPQERAVPNELHKRDIEETIRDLLIWKYILLGMLFSTAPDNTDLIKSGVWDHIVPII